jgi:hypothetical protein
MFIDEAGTVLRVPVRDGKPRLLEVADLIAYVSARVLAEIRSDLMPFKRLFQILEPERIQFGRAPDGGLGVGVPKTSLGPAALP